MEVSRDHITHLLNALYTEGITTISVKHPCEEVGELLKIDISDPVATRVTFTQGAITYQDAREEIHPTYGEQAYDELPNKETYIRALVAGGLIDIENSDQVTSSFGSRAILILIQATSLLLWGSIQIYSRGG